MENDIWSKNIQGIINLDLSREMRFRDDRKDLFLNILGLTEGMTILDIGCGPGTIARKLSKWLGEKSKIIGIDRDTEFIKYAREKAIKMSLNNISYYEGDALSIPLEDNSVDACISHTVIEHVPNKEFLLEQKRVCKLKGRVSVMYMRPDKYIRTEPDLVPKQSKREEELFDKLFKESDEINNEYSVGKYWPDPVGLPRLLEELGFNNIQIDAIAIPIVIDDSRNKINEKMAIVRSEKEQLFEGINIATCLKRDKLSDNELIELKELITERTNQRLKFIKEGKNIWDYSILSLQVVSGMVE
ncbi:methyltransferase domain-containing protein [Clostridium sp. D2Q-14]|uniref:class I SAM-dependent methyltransferase n=1 Tax=Anaeromonas gelatinilytica TaxID=2683194 RepID=UPI00193C6BA6|nr:methyltransferase domain-containing protein [Anaeromonas gelatinilytica]MBS4535319.1 methyltransferase domain-containing protein [Anaeromonas gelatinilytica]